MTPIQATGSTTTYLKRYLIGMTFALVLSDEQDDDGEAMRYLARQAMPASLPPVVEAPKRQSIAEWLDALAMELAACEGEAEVDAILSRNDVQRAQDRLTNGAKDRLDHLIQEAIRRTAAAETSAPNDGVFADPKDDPFLQPARETA